MKKNKYLVIVLIAILTISIGGLSGYFILNSQNKTPSSSSSKRIDKINSFKECAESGYPIQESFPERCSVPGGKTFTNNQVK